MKCRGKNGKCGRDVEEGLYCAGCTPLPRGTLYLRRFISEDPADFEEPAQHVEDADDHDTSK
jgi:hypothetical protein